MNRFSAAMRGLTEALARHHFTVNHEERTLPLDELTSYVMALGIEKTAAEELVRWATTGATLALQRGTPDVNTLAWSLIMATAVGAKVERERTLEHGPRAL